MMYLPSSLDSRSFVTGYPFNPQNLTLQPGLSRLQGAYETDYPIIMAGGVLASIPVLILFIFAQRYIIEGVSRSGLKG